jgi:hypothetical protein
MSSASKIVTRTSETKRPRAQRGLARLVIVLAWATFWLNSAFLPCCQAVAAGVGDQLLTHAVSHTHPAHHFDETHTGHSHPSPHPPCDELVSAGPATFVQAAVLAAGHPEFAAITSNATISVRPAAVSAFALTAYSTPPPKVPLYLRELRILL